MPCASLGRPERTQASAELRERPQRLRHRRAEWESGVGQFVLEAASARRSDRRAEDAAILGAVDIQTGRRHSLRRNCIVVIKTRAQPPTAALGDIRGLDDSVSKDL